MASFFLSLRLSCSGVNLENANELLIASCFCLLNIDTDDDDVDDNDDNINDQFNPSQAITNEENKLSTQLFYRKKFKLRRERKQLNGMEVIPNEGN